MSDETMTLEAIRPWVERTSAMARADARIAAFEVRADVRDSRRIVAVKSAIRGTRINHVAGLGIRVFAGGGRSYAYANDLSDRGLREMLERAVSLALVNGKQRWRGFDAALGPTRRVSYAPQVEGRPDAASPEEVLSLLRRAEEGAREVAPDITAQISFGSLSSGVLVADSQGSEVEVESLLSTLLVQAVAKDAGRVADGNEWRGGERGVADYEDRGGPEGLGREAARQALEALRAVPLPAGRHRTLTDPHMSGLLAHESFGHLTEFDLVASGWSVLQGKLGERLAAPAVTIRDAPVVEGRFRQGVAVPYDEEGTPGRAVTLLDRGVLSSYMHTRDSAAASGIAATGNGRALDTRFAPIVRMRNTFFEPGEAKLDEAVKDLRDGVYLIGGRGGAPRSDGSFMFTAKRGYLVEGGEVKAPIRSVAIHGNVLEYLKNVERVYDDFEVHTNYFGGCGKWDQSFLHVGTGGPHVLVKEALVGGQGA